MTSDQPMSDDELEHARRRQADPLVQVSQTETVLLQEVDRLRAVAEEHRQTARHAYYDVQALQLERERLEGEVARLRAENTAQAAQVAAATELRKAWDILPEELDRAASDTHRRVLQQIRGCGALLAAALGLVQDREGQANEAS